MRNVLSSRYRPDDLLVTEDGAALPRTLAAGGIYAPDEPVDLLTVATGRLALGFPAKAEWARGEPTPDVSMPWPGWRGVEIDPPAALTRFLRLTAPEDVQKFAQRYGPLWICAEHNRRLPNNCFWKGVNMYGCSWVNVEPVDLYVALSKQMAGVLTAAARLRDGEALHATDWRAIGWPTPDETLSITVQGIFVVAVVNSELERAAVTPHVTPDFRLELNAGLGFLPQLWLQVAAACGGGRAFALCSACGSLYARRHRSARRGQRNYCPTCTESGARQRLSRQAYKG